MSSNSCRTSGLAQLKSGCSGANRCRYHSPGVPSGAVVLVHAGPPKIDGQSVGGRAPPPRRPAGGGRAGRGGPAEDRRPVVRREVTAGTAPGPEPEPVAFG